MDMIEREDFIARIESLRKQKEHDRKCAKAFAFILPNNYLSLYDNSELENSLISLLMNLTNDKSEWITYYIYELDFGRKYKKGSVTFNGKDIKLKTPSDLWDILTKKYK